MMVVMKQIILVGRTHRQDGEALSFDEAIVTMTEDNHGRENVPANGD